MQQAARISDETAFFYLGNLVEYNKTEKIFTNPDVKHTETISPAGSVDIRLEELLWKKESIQVHIMKWNCRK